MKEKLVNNMQINEEIKSSLKDDLQQKKRKLNFAINSKTFQQYLKKKEGLGKRRKLWIRINKVSVSTEFKLKLELSFSSPDELEFPDNGANSYEYAPLIIICIRMNMEQNCLFLLRPPLMTINSKNFNTYLHNANYCIAETTGDGFCYMNAVQKVMALDYNKYLSIEDMQSEILCHLIHNDNLYSAYHEGDIAKDCELFFYK